MIVCFNDEMDVILLHGKINDSESESAGVHYCPFQKPQGCLIPDQSFVAEVTVSRDRWAPPLERILSLPEPGRLPLHRPL